MNRCLHDSDEKHFEVLSGQDEKFFYELKIKANKKIKYLLPVKQCLRSHRTVVLNDVDAFFLFYPYTPSQ